MSNQGIYEAELPCGGKLRISAIDWEISYYFPGPDNRYNGTFVSIPGEQLDQYILAYKKNWNEYVKLKSSIPEGGEFSKEGELEMSIRVGDSFEGVCLRSYHMPINNKDDLIKVIEGYQYAKNKSSKIQQFLADL